MMSFNKRGQNTHTYKEALESRVWGQQPQRRDRLGLCSFSECGWGYLYEDGWTCPL